MNEVGIPEFEFVDFLFVPERILGFYLLPQLVAGLGVFNPGEPLLVTILQGVKHSSRVR